MASTVNFNNISYYVPVRGLFCKEKKKQILFDISGIFKPGMNAILGPTGSGKTTLLDILAGRIDKSGLEGKVLVDGKKQPKDFNNISGYVVQDDLVMGTLTVEENIKFSADLRLPRNVTNYEREGKVKKVIEELGLSKCAQSKIGTEFIRGVSGGERKRTSIGMELITSPMVLFLDEPTTGLDATTATSVMTTLKRLSEKGNTVIFSIHQPRYAIYRLFDSLMLLSAGETIYHGPASQALNHFSSIGYQCEEHNNPPDFFLDVIIENEIKIKNQKNKIIDEQKQPRNVEKKNKKENNPENKTDKANGHISTSNQAHVNKSYTEIEMPGNIQQHLPKLFESSPQNKQLNIELDEIVSGEDSKEWDIVRGYKAGFFKQFYHVGKRALINSVRDPVTILLQTLSTVFVAVLTGVLYRDLGTEDVEEAIENRTGAIFFIIIYKMFNSLTSLQLFITEKSIFIHESAAGYYRVSAFFIAKVVCDIFLMRLFPCIIFSVITYFMIGFQIEIVKFFIYLLVIFLVLLTATALTILLSSIIDSFQVANLLISLIYVLMLLFGGFFVRLDSVDDWLSWLKYFSITRYGVKPVMINEFSGLYDKGTNNSAIVLKELRQLEVDLESTWALWENIVALGCMTIILFILSYVSLRRIPKHK